MKLKVIDENWLNAQIRFLENASKKIELSNKDSALLEYIKEVKKELQPLTPFIKDAFKAGREHEDVYGFAEDEVRFINDLEEYLKENNYE